VVAVVAARVHGAANSRESLIIRGGLGG